ncbi:hypothetical protein SERLA73DRAFT_154969 [Serpula lacrymans var. lacrymans S7.3]|uniref:Uncharacterized protein n=1 Tax=Serpula lacrymans var. lacrymans (strain S7.3) TaxID=936435 RepID=F8Q7S6_SERL3|nr:hypothetical protein SERLA73DRAFT_154969 [Serpula lacrymans var. lacrymans S7.3]
MSWFSNAFPITPLALGLEPSSLITSTIVKVSNIRESLVTDEECRSLKEFHRALNNRDLHVAVPVNAATDPQPAHSDTKTEYYEDSSAASSPISELEGLVLAVNDLAFKISQLRQYVALTRGRIRSCSNLLLGIRSSIQRIVQRILEPPCRNNSEERRALRRRAAEHKTALLILSDGISPRIYHLQNYVKTPQLAFSPEQDGREIHYLLPCGIIIHRRPYSAPYLEFLTPYLEPSRIDIYVTASFNPTPLELLFTRIGIYETDLIKFYREIPFFDLPLTPEQNNTFNPRDYLKTGVHVLVVTPFCRDAIRRIVACISQFCRLVFKIRHEILEGRDWEREQRQIRNVCRLFREYQNYAKEVFDLVIRHPTDCFIVTEINTEFWGVLIRDNNRVYSQYKRGYHLTRGNFSYIPPVSSLIQGNILIERTPSPDEATSNLDSRKRFGRRREYFWVYF